MKAFPSFPVALTNAPTRGEFAFGDVKKWGPSIPGAYAATDKPMVKSAFRQQHRPRGSRRKIAVPDACPCCDPLHRGAAARGRLFNVVVYFRSAQQRLDDALFGSGHRSRFASNPSAPRSHRHVYARR
jgi:hypothetical protein